jgi:hypothetical protein
MAMTCKPAWVGVLWAGLVLGQAGTGLAQSNVDFTVSGTSTVRSWTCEAKGALVTSAGSASTQPIPGLDGGVPSATVTVPLKAFKCPNEEMTQHLNEAMKSDKFADIVFKLEKYEIAAGQGQATGAMTIVGNTQPFTVPITLKPGPQGVELSGDTRLDMTKFGVDPPVVMLGLMKVGAQIRIQFKGVVAK